MKYEVVGAPRIESEYCDAWESVMVIDLQREDGETGDVWIVAGIPEYQRGTALASSGCESIAASAYPGMMTVSVFGDSVDTWCPDSFKVRDEDGYYQTVRDDVIAACERSALTAHRQRLAVAAEVREFVESYQDDDEIDDDELVRIFHLAYDRDPDYKDRETGLWSLICAATC